MRLIRYDRGDEARLAAADEDGKVFPLAAEDVMAIVREAREAGVTTTAYVRRLVEAVTPIEAGLDELRLLPPVEAPEVWAAGVTYQRSREARNYEATGGKLDASTFYDKVYDAERPELFLKSTAARTVGTGETVCLRSDSSWQVPEPELGLVLDRAGTIVGYTIGNDMSCRDIEGENPLYLPQAKVWRRSCAIGPCIVPVDAIEDPYALDIALRIYRGGEKVVDERASTGQLKRRLDELVSYLARDNELFDGTVLLTGTCVVPPNQFTLEPGDRIEIDIEGIGTLVNVAERA
ncbi:fumarylacetoacetate hydrolase family protein [Paenibacillus sp.]|uniref:fumarylacetoacetate hydrolase family protein n=1 Tax=Paenibacillus sp. TaxID=58172 RepID=UPI002D64206B|nr:fumarylacetoacetate hydrolase family protein [Paenibacillus sp.]HZG56356.1 fumarylacetoacetate hydrolase family protein [Paenibacillus sp.]